MNQSLAKCWLFKLNNAKYLGFTDHDVDLHIDGMIYHANNGSVRFIGNHIRNAPDSIELENTLSHDLISIKDVLEGLYDNAEIKVFYIDINDIYSKKWSKSGFISEIKLEGEKVTAKIEGITCAFDKEICETYSENCRALLGDNRCKVNIEKYSLECYIASIIDKKRFLINYKKGVNNKNYYYSRGKAIFNNSNSKLEIEILNIVGQEVVLANQIPYDSKIGDMITIKPGCNKTLAMCSQVYNNVLNFRGEPHIPNIGDIL